MVCRECSRAPLLPRHPARHAALTSCTVSVRGTRACSSARPDPGGGRCDDASNTPFWERLFLQLYVLCVCAPSFPEFSCMLFFFGHAITCFTCSCVRMRSCNLRRCSAASRRISEILRDRHLENGQLIDPTPTRISQSWSVSPSRNEGAPNFSPFCEACASKSIATR